MTNLNYNNEEINPATTNKNSVNCCTSRVAGFYKSKEITLSGNNETVTTNVFQIAGLVELKNFVLEVTDATVLNNCTELQIDLYDGTNTIPLSTNGALISGMGVGTIIIKDLDKTKDLTVLNNSQCRILEKADKDTHQPFLVLQKSGTNTYIRFKYKTTDTPINAKINFIIAYTCVNGGTLEVV